MRILVLFRKLGILNRTYLETTAVVSISLGLGPKYLNIEIRISSGMLSAVITPDFSFCGRSQMSS
jgi:hypothetical protein